jgi:hypothetical protein
MREPIMTRYAGRLCVGLLTSLSIAAALPAAAQAQQGSDPRAGVSAHQPQQPPPRAPGRAPSAPGGSFAPRPGPPMMQGQRPFAPGAWAGPGVFASRPAVAAASGPLNQPAAMHQGFRGDVSHLGAREFGAWHGGQWRHEHHNGRFGWWWVVGGAWYNYPEPLYPYPSYISGDYDEGQSAPAYSWYYCDYPAGYYPYVQSCAYPWRTVPAQPQAPPAY